MAASLIVCVLFASCGLILLLFLPWILRSSPEAERMFALVKSTREDRRHIGLLERLSDRLARRSRQLRGTLGNGGDTKLRRRFAAAGLRSPRAPDLFLWVQGAGLIGGAVMGSFAPSSAIFWALAGGAGGFMAPDFWLDSQQRRRSNRLRRSIPDMVDLLVICVGAGLGLDQALIRVTAELTLSHPELSEELGRVLLERTAGASRIDAWRSLAERTRLEEIGLFVSMLAETDRFGSPIIAALSQFSDELRTKRRQKAEEAAAKTKVKIIFPLVLCIFPCIFLVLLVPALLGFLHSFGSMGR